MLWALWVPYWCLGLRVFEPHRRHSPNPVHAFFRVVLHVGDVVMRRQDTRVAQVFESRNLLPSPFREECALQVSRDARDSDSTKPSPLRPSASAQVLGWNDVEHEPRRVGEEDLGRLENNKEGVLCGSNDMARATSDKMRTFLWAQLKHLEPWATGVVQRMSATWCADEVCVCTCNVGRCSVHTPSIAWPLKAAGKRKKLPEQWEKKAVGITSGCEVQLCHRVFLCWWFRPLKNFYCSVQVEDRQQTQLCFGFHSLFCCHCEDEDELVEG